MRRISRIGWLAALTLASAAALAVDGEYDPDWANGGRLTIDVSPESDKTETLLIQPDGKLVMAGRCGVLLCVTRLLPSGSYDASFGPVEHPGRVFYSAEFSVEYVGAVLTTDGGVVLAGAYGPGFTLGLLAKFNAQGALVFDYGYGGGAGITAYSMVAIAAAADGKIIAVSQQVVGTTSVFAVTRMMDNLNVDAIFGDGGTKLIAFDDSAYPTAVAIQPDGKIVVVGAASFKIAALRLLSNGQLDDDPVLGFGDGGRALLDWVSDDHVDTVTVDRDGTLLLAGYGLLGSLNQYDFFVNRLTSRGQQHPGFGACPPPVCNFVPGPVHIDIRGLGHNDYAGTLAVQSDGKILAGGIGNRGDGTTYFSMARLLPSGDPDPSFGINGRLWGYYGAVSRDDDVSAIAIGNGGLMIAGRSREATGNDHRFGIAKLKLRSDEMFAAGFE